MQSIEIDNFGPIKSARIELRPLIVFIGEQASGKSTIAKLIYFFKTLGESFFSSYLNSDLIKINWQEHIIFPIRDKFNELFGSTQTFLDFRITFWYDDERNITLSPSEKKRLKVQVSQEFFSQEIKCQLNYHKRAFMRFKEKLAGNPTLIESIGFSENLKYHSQALYKAINSLFLSDHNDSLYIMAGRNSTVSFADLFEDYYAKVYFRDLVDIGRSTKNYKIQTIDESLFLEYISKVRKIRQTFKNAGNFEGMIHHCPKEKKDILVSANKIIRKILHGQYADAGEDERIVFGNNKFVYLKDASSGQQEAIRILQDLFLILRSDNTVLRVIEEPEAHLYPETQKYLLQLIVMILNTNPTNQVIITTHSPYTLSILNNLLYAAQVADINKKGVMKLVRKDFWLKASKVSAYQIVNGMTHSIEDNDNGLIRAEVIDGISEILNEEMDKLITLEIEEEDDAEEKNREKKEI